MIWYLTFCSGESENEKPASSEQVEELQTQTTNLGLQLRKQMEDNTGTYYIILILLESVILL